jgi:hypothetical protein
MEDDPAPATGAGRTPTPNAPSSVEQGKRGRRGPLLWMRHLPPNRGRGACRSHRFSAGDVDSPPRGGADDRPARGKAPPPELCLPQPRLLRCSEVGVELDDVVADDRAEDMSSGFAAAGSASCKGHRIRLAQGHYRQPSSTDRPCPPCTSSSSGARRPPGRDQPREMVPGEQRRGKPVGWRGVRR